MTKQETELYKSMLKTYGFIMLGETAQLWCFALEMAIVLLSEHMPYYDKNHLH